MLNSFFVDSFREAAMREVHKRIGTYVDPEAKWPPFVMMDANEKFLATELGPEHFESPETLEVMFTEYIPETLENLHAEMAAFIKPVWIGKAPPNDVNYFHQGILMVLAYPRGSLE